MWQIGAIRILLNVIRAVFGGFWPFFSCLFFGLIAYLLIVTVPTGVASLRIVAYVLQPFRREVAPALGAGAMSGVGNTIWFLVAGLWLAVGHLITAVVQAITTIGIPLAVASTKLTPVTCFPFGKQIIETYQGVSGDSPVGDGLAVMCSRVHA